MIETIKRNGNAYTVTLMDDKGTKTDKTVAFGTGRYSGLMAEAFADGMRLFDWTAKQAETYANALGAEYGRVLSQQANVKFGKLSDNGKVTLKESMSVKGLTITPCLSIAMALVKANELSALGFVPDSIIIQNENASEWFNGLFAEKKPETAPAPVNS